MLEDSCVVELWCCVGQGRSWVRDAVGVGGQLHSGVMVLCRSREELGNGCSGCWRTVA